jgi:hypothetical protein
MKHVLVWSLDGTICASYIFGMPTRNSLKSDFGNDIKTYKKLGFRARDFLGHVEQKFE